MPDKLPYIISADAEHLMNTWGERNNLKMPDSSFFADFQSGCIEHITDAASFGDNNFEPMVIPHDKLASELQGLVSRYRQEGVVALDRAYIGDSITRHLEVTRAVNTKLESIGTQPRPYTPSISKQIDRLVANSDTDLTLVDDVIFSGDAIIEAAELFHAKGARVRTVLAAIAIGEGRKKIEEAGIEVNSVIEYADVKDEICERDFLAGIPFSGRTVYREDGGHYSAPYFAPFGLPERWASIEDATAAQKLSLYCIERSIELWQKVEQLNEVTMPHNSVPRPLEYGASSESFPKYLSVAKTMLLTHESI